MEKYIEEVVNADKLAREKVENARKQLLEITNLVSSTSQEIYQKLMDEEKQEMEKIQKKIATEIEEVKVRCNQETELGLKSLEERFSANKEKWMNQIVENCIQ